MSFMYTGELGRGHFAELMYTGITLSPGYRDSKHCVSIMAPAEGHLPAVLTTVLYSGLTSLLSVQALLPEVTSVLQFPVFSLDLLD